MKEVVIILIRTFGNQFLGSKMSIWLMVVHSNRKPFTMLILIMLIKLLFWVMIQHLDLMSQMKC